MKKHTKIIIIALGIIILGQFIFNKINSRNVTKLELSHKEELKKIKKEARETSLLEMKEKISESKNYIDSLLNINEKIKYVPYEKIIYIDRTLDDAVIIIDSTEY